MSPRFEAPRGTHDVLPSEQPRWDRVLSEAEELCRVYGYRRIATPTFEDTELFARTSGEASDVVNKEMYTFQDRGGRSLTLRPEATAGVCRAYVEHGMHRLPQPVKTWTVGPMFRYAKPQKGRFREFWQLNLEAIGSDDPAVDAELILFQSELLSRLGIEAEPLLNSIGDRRCRPDYAEQLSAWLDEHEAELDEEARHKRATSALRVFDTKNTRMIDLLEGAPLIGDALCDECRQHFTEVRRYLDDYGVRYTLSPRLVRGLDYYTRTTFEFVVGGLGAEATVSAGGRYDYLVEQIGGPPTPGVGFAMGLERIVATLAPDEAGDQRPDVFFVLLSTEPESRTEVMRAAVALRREGISCEFDLAGRSPGDHGGQMKHAVRLNPRMIAFVSGAVATIRRRQKQDETVSLVPHEVLVSRVQRLLTDAS